VELGVTVGGNVEVRSDIEPGRLVVVRGNERLRSGMSVAFEQPRN
jgi:multidrug efflux pump subunit AcrA (membrane-fusion protein)